MNYAKIIESVKREQRKICSIQLHLTKIEHAASVAYEMLKIEVDEGESTFASRETLKMLRGSLAALNRLRKRWDNGLGEKISKSTP